MLKCEICGKEFRIIQWSHLKRHDMTIGEYKGKFPIVEIVSEGTKRRLSKLMKGDNNRAKRPEVREKISKALKGRKFSDEHKQNLSMALKGHLPWNRGLTKETDKRIRRGFKPWNKGKPLSLETKLKISKALKGRKISEEVRRKLSSEYRREKNPFYGRKHSDETLRKISMKLKGKNNPRWKGGREDYRGPDWWEQRERARKRDNYTCQICGGKEDGWKLPVHHIISFEEFGLERYREANQLSNLITLCRHCHGKADGGKIPTDVLKGMIVSG